MKSWRTYAALGLLLALTGAFSSEGAASPAISGYCHKVAGLNDNCPALVETFGHLAHGGTDEAMALAVNRSGNRMYVTGCSSCNNLSAGATVAYSSAGGAALWSAHYDNGPNTASWPVHIVVSPDGKRVFVTAWTASRTAGGTLVNPRVGTVAYDAGTGRQLWRTAYVGPRTEGAVPAALVLSPDGRALYVGVVQDTDAVFGLGSPQKALLDYACWTACDYGVVAYDTTTGRRLWSARAARPYGKRDRLWLRELSASRDGRLVLATGSVAHYGHALYLTVAYWASGRKAGQLAWQRTYTPATTANASAFSTAISPDGSRIYVSGITQLADSSTQYLATVTYDRSGRLLKVTFDPRTYAGQDWPQTWLLVSADGKRYYVLDPELDLFARKTSDGSALWGGRLTYPAGLSVLATGLALSPDGRRLYAIASAHPNANAGTYQPGTLTDGDYLTIAVDTATHSQVWSAYYNSTSGFLAGTDNDYPQAAAVSPDSSRVYVTGGFHLLTGCLAESATLNQQPVSNCDEFGTVAYPASP